MQKQLILCILFLIGITGCWSNVMNTAIRMRPKKLTVISDTEGGDWNTARAICVRRNMTLASIDLYAFFFLVSQSFLPQFQKYAGRHFWIGLYNENTRDQTNAVGEYRWTADCEMLSSMQMLWDTGHPQNTTDAHCVYAVGSSMRWRTDLCSSRHQILCQKKEEQCYYNFTLLTCTLYVRASERREINNGSPSQCEQTCDNSSMDSMPCWGFTLMPPGCVLYYQTTQPNCRAVHRRTSAVIRICFKISYEERIFSNLTSDGDGNLPIVPHCGAHGNDTENGKPSTSTTVLLTTDQSPASTEQHTTENSTIITSNQSAEYSTAQDPTTTATTNSAENLKTQNPTTTATTNSAEHPTTQNPTTMATINFTEHTTEQNATTTAAINSTEYSATPQIPTTTATIRKSTEDSTSKPQFPRPNPVFVPEKCSCKCDVTTRNRSTVLKEVAVTKHDLTVDVKTLSSTRRKKKSASDCRVASKGIAYVGIAFVLLAFLVIVVPDIVTLTYHLRYGVPRLKNGKPRRRVRHIS